MKLASTLISALALGAALGFAAPAFAQDHMMNGMAVPADQMDTVQARCDELHAGTSTGTSSTAGTQETTNTSGTAGNSTDNAAGGTLADTKDATTTTNAGSSDSGSQGQDSNSANTTANNAAANTSTGIDLASMTVDMCDTGGFKAKM